MDMLNDKEGKRIKLEKTDFTPEYLSKFPTVVREALEDEKNKNVYWRILTESLRRYRYIGQYIEEIKWRKMISGVMCWSV